MTQENNVIDVTNNIIDIQDASDIPVDASATDITKIIHRQVKFGGKHQALQALSDIFPFGLV